MSELKFTADIEINQLQQKLQKIDWEFNQVAKEAAMAGSVIDEIFKKSATNSISAMALKVDELRNAYNNLNAADRVKYGEGIAREISDLSSKIEFAKNQFISLESGAVGSIDSMVLKMAELQRQFNALSAADRVSIGGEYQKEIQMLAKSIEEAKSQFKSMENVAEDSINGMIDKFIELNRQYNNLSANDRVTIGEGLQKQMVNLSSDIEAAKKQFVSLSAVSEDSIEGMTLKLMELNKQYKALSSSDRDTIGPKLAQDMAILSGEIDKANMKMRASAGTVGTFNKSFDQLGYSVQQIARELPNAAISPQLFIMAISNNLPILAENIARVKDQNAALNASGQASVPVWKQVAGSIFSWQTGLILGITALMMWGDKIPGVMKDLLSLGKGFKLSSDELKNLNENLAKSAGSELSKLKGLFDALENAKEGTIEYADAKGAIIDQYGKNLEGMDAEIRSLTDVRGAYEALTKSIYETAKAKSLKDLRADLGEDLIKKTTPEFENLSKLLAGGVNEIYKQTIMDAARYGKELSYDAQRVVDSFTVKKTVNSDQVIGTDNLGNVQYGKKVIDYNPVIESMTKIKKIQDDTNQAYKEGENYADAIFGINTQSKVKNLVKDLEAQLKVAQAMPQDTTTNIAARNQAIKAIEDQIKVYKELGVEKEKGAGKIAEEELAKSKEALTNAIIANNQKEITFQAAKIALLERELELRKWIAYEAVAYAKGNITQIDRKADNNPSQLTLKTLPSTGIAKVGQIRMFDGVMQELIEIDKKGREIWKNRKLETNDLAKLVKEKGKNAAKDQEKLDKDSFNLKLDKQEAILNYSRQFTSELINQLGLTEDQNKVLNGMADTIANLASGFITGNPIDFIAAAFSGVSTLISTIFSGNGKEDSTTKALERTNQLLSQQAAILSNMPNAQPYFELAAKQYLDYGTAIELTNQKLQNSYIITKEEQAKLLALPTKPAEYTGSDPYEKAKYKKELEAYNNARTEINKVNAEIAAGMNERKNWSPEQFIEAYANGSLILDKQQIDWINEITEKQKQRAELLQETFRQALGFDSTSIADSIIQDIDDGLRLAADGSLGGFAKSFGEQIKEALVKGIREGLEMKLTEGFMTDFTSFLSVNSDGGTTLTPDELAKLESQFASAVKGSTEAMAAIQPILDKYGLNLNQSNTALTGISSQLTEETGSLIAGIGTAIRIDVKALLGFSQNQLSLMDAQLSTLNQIEKNTRHNAELPGIKAELQAMTRIMNERL